MKVAINRLLDAAPHQALPNLRESSTPLWLYGIGGIAIAFLALPILGLLGVTSWTHATAALESEVTQQALALSLWTSTLSTLLVIVFGGVLAYVLARHPFKGAVLVDTLVDIPMVLPPMVAGIALLMFFGRHGPAGSALAEHGVQFTFTPIAVVLAQVFVALPFFVRAARAAFEGIDPRLERASLLLGASRRRTFFQVVVPTVWPPLLAGAVLAWARCLGEFGATLVFAGNFQGKTQTMPLAIFGAMQDDMNVALILSVMLLAVSFVLVIVLKLVVSRYGGRHVAA